MFVRFTLVIYYQYDPHTAARAGTQATTLQPDEPYAEARHSGEKPSMPEQSVESAVHAHGPVDSPTEPTVVTSPVDITGWSSVEEEELSISTSTNPSRTEETVRTIPFYLDNLFGCICIHVLVSVCTNISN
jgi:hypothetical protein